MSDILTNDQKQIELWVECGCNDCLRKSTNFLLNKLDTCQKNLRHVQAERDRFNQAVKDAVSEKIDEVAYEREKWLQLSELESEMRRQRDETLKENARLQADNERLKQATFESLRADAKGISMKMGGVASLQFMAALVEFFEINNGKNFLTLTVEKEEHRYSITIQNLNGELSPSEKMNQIQQENARLQAENEQTKKWANGVADNATAVVREKIRLEEENARLREERNNYMQLLQMIVNPCDHHMGRESIMEMAKTELDKFGRDYNWQAVAAKRYNEAQHDLAKQVQEDMDWRLRQEG